MWDFIQKLRVRTDEGKVKWERTADEGVYQSSFASYTVRVLPRPGNLRPADYAMQILDQEGSVVEEILSEDLTNMANLSASIAFDLMRDLYGSARRRAMGVDEALDELMKSLA